MFKKSIYSLVMLTVITPITEVSALRTKRPIYTNRHHRVIKAAPLHKHRVVRRPMIRKRPTARRPIVRRSYQRRNVSSIRNYSTLSNVSGAAKTSVDFLTQERNRIISNTHVANDLRIVMNGLMEAVKQDSSIINTINNDNVKNIVSFVNRLSSLQAVNAEKGISFARDIEFLVRSMYRVAGLPINNSPNTNSLANVDFNRLHILTNNASKITAFMRAQGNDQSSQVYIRNFNDYLRQLREYNSSPDNINLTRMILADFEAFTTAVANSIR